MTTLTEGAFAKLNLTLDVLDRREDGYHTLSSVMQTISIRDDIEIQLGEGTEWSLTCDVQEIPSDASNLAWRAAECFYRNLGGRPAGLRIHITKRIPSGAGLGGGSAEGQETICFSGGKIGYQMETSLSELEKVIPFELSDITI